MVNTMGTNTTTPKVAKEATIDLTEKDLVANYYKKASLASQVSGYTQVAQGAFDLWDTYDARSALRLTNKQLDTEKEVIDLINSEDVSLLDTMK